jgi:hypothetical protein
MHQVLCCIEQEIIFLANFRQLATKKRVGESNKGIFENLLKKIRHISRKKVRSRQI